MTLVLDSQSGSPSHHAVMVKPATITKLAIATILAVTIPFVSQAHAPSVVELHLVRSIHAVSSTFGPLTIPNAVSSSSKSNLIGPLVLSADEFQVSHGGPVHVANNLVRSAGSHLQGPLVLASTHN